MPHFRDAVFRPNFVSIGSTNVGLSKVGLVCLATAVLIASAASSSATPITLAQLPPSQATSIIGAHNLALSPDGSMLAFAYHDDIWVVSAKGGVARRVTDNESESNYPLFSPDGKWLAFANRRDGTYKIYVTAVDGGPVVQLTHFSANEIPSDWSPDGKSIAFVSRRNSIYPGIYTVDVNTGATHRLLQDNIGLSSPRWTEDGKTLYYDRIAEFPWFRPRYHGSGAGELWKLNLESGKSTLIEANEFQHLWPTLGFGGKGLMAVTATTLTPSSSPVNKSIGKWTDSIQRTPNVYWYFGGKKQRVTDLIGFEGTRFLTSAKDANLIAFESGGKVFTNTPGTSPVQLSITLTEDYKTNPNVPTVSTTGANSPVLSPDGSRAVFVLNHDLWMVPVKKGFGPNKDDAVRLTAWSGEDAHPLWLPDGKTIAFLSDREDVLRVYTMNVDTRQVTPVNTDSDDAGDLQLVPGGKAISFWVSGGNGGLYEWKIGSTDKPKLVLHQENIAGTNGQQGSYAWSPDGSLIAFTKPLLGSGFMPWNDATNVFVEDAATGKVTNVTELAASQDSPSFSADGRFLYFVSDRGGPGIYMAALHQEDARLSDQELKYTKPKGDVKVTFDAENISQRVSRLVALPDANAGLIKSDPNTGTLYFLRGGNVMKVGYDGSGLGNLTNSGHVFTYAPASDWKSVIVSDGGTMQKVPLEGPPNPSTIAFRAAYSMDSLAQHRAAFEQFWRIYNQQFYDPNFHGRDWSAIKKHYKPLADAAATSADIALVLNEMVGELESSHSEVSAASGGPVPAPDGMPGFFIDYSYSGPGIKVKSVPDHSPADYSKTEIKPGEIVTDINGIPVSLNEKLWSVLEGQADRDATFTVLNPDTKKTRTVRYRLLNGGDWSGLVQDDLDAKRRAEVEAESNGELTYVRIAAMNDASLQKFTQQVFQYTHGKKGFIIDVRGNGGGNTGDQIIDILKRAPHAIYRGRDMTAALAPGQMLDMPFAVLAGRNSFSNAEMYPAAVQDAKLGLIVGTKTPGYVIWTHGAVLVDGTHMRIPGSGSYRLDGTPLEDVGVTPDIVVHDDPQEYLAGHDAQLDAAVKAMMKKIDRK